MQSIALVRLARAVRAVNLALLTCAAACSSRQHERSVDAGQGCATRSHAAGDAGTEPCPAEHTNSIADENRQPGSAGWVVSQPSDPKQHELEAYGSRISGKAGDVLDVHVNVDAASDVHWQLYRLGYYQGLGGRLMSEGDAGHIEPQPGCPVDPATGMIACQWTPAFSIAIQPEWVSGYYVVKLVREEGFEAVVPLIVTETTPHARALVQAPVNTWQAYNAWGGTSLYANKLPEPRPYTGNAAVKVSFDRPFDRILEGTMLGTERPLVWWLEQRGYDVAYTTNVEVSRGEARLDSRQLFVVVGHDEYWTHAERELVDEARQAGVSIMFLGANIGYWRIRYDSSEQAPDRVVTCFKGKPGDPERGQPDESTRFRDAPHAQPENELVGVMYELRTILDAYPMIVSEPDSWLFKGTGVKRGDSLGNLVGNEWDHVFPEGTPAGLEVVTRSPALGCYGSSVESESALYYPTPRSFVYAGGSIRWAWGLGLPGYTDSRLQRMVDNMFARARVLPTTEAARVASERGQPLAVSPEMRAVSLVAGGGEAGYHDGAADAALFNYPAGVAEGPDGTLYVTDTRNHRIRAIHGDGTVSTLAGCGPTNETRNKFANGSGKEACFSAPTAIVLGPDQALYVADSLNNRIRRVTLAGVVTTYAGSGVQGAKDGPRDSAEFSFPQGLAFDAKGALYVADGINNSLRRIASDGTVSTVATDLHWPTAVAMGPDGTIYVLESETGDIFSMHGSARRRVVTSTSHQPASDPPPPALHHVPIRLRPVGGLLYVKGELVFADSGNYALRSLRLSDGRLSLLAGGHEHTGLSLGKPAEAELVLPRGLASAKDGSLILVDAGNHRVVRVTGAGTPGAAH